MSFQVNITLEWMPEEPVDGKSTLDQAIAWCHQATSHYMQGCQPWEIDFLTIYQKLPKFSLLNGIFSLLKHEMVSDYFKQFPYFAEN